MNPRNTNLLARIADEDLRNAAEAALNVADRMRARRTMLEQSGRYTETGLRAAMADELTKTFAPEWRKAQAPIAARLMAIKDRRDLLALPAPDPTNVAAAMERQEIRAYLRGLSLSERTQLALATKDQRIIEAVLTAPAMLSGLPEDRVAHLRDRQLTTTHGAEMAKIGEAQSVVDEALAVVTVAKGDLANVAGLPTAQFAAVMQNEKQGAPWLKRDGAQIIRVIPGQSVYPPATAEEIATGKFYATQVEYDEDRAA